jgi:glycosyltransferase involved in cell wall biosynthesis
MTARPFFSVLTASLNQGSTLGHVLRSVQQQVFTGVEHIVIDGCSQDDTLSVLNTFSGSYDLRFVSEPDRGISDALNKGVTKSRGAYFLVIQADDQLIDQGILEKVFPLLQDEHYDIHSFPVIVDHPELGKFLRCPVPVLWWNRFKFIFPHQGAFVHRRVFERIGGFREDFSIAMDYDFFYRAVLAGCTVKFHRAPPVAMMGGSGIGTRLDFLRRRLKEESLVQEMNERNTLWRMGQIVFKRLYHPYKMWLLPRLKWHGKNRLPFDPARNPSEDRFPD